MLLQYLHLDLVATAAYALVGLYTLLFHNHFQNNSSIDRGNSRNTSCHTNSIHSISSNRILRRRTSSFAILLWSCRSAVFQLYRLYGNNLQLGRPDTVAMSPRSVAFVWLTHALWGILCCAPHTAAAAAPTKVASGSTSTTTLYVGVVTFLIGWIIEAMTDQQPTLLFRQTPTVAEVGLWSISQYPIWFGSLLVWIGIFVINAPLYYDDDCIHQATTTATPAATTIFKSEGRMNRNCQTMLKFLYRRRRYIFALYGPIGMYIVFTVKGIVGILFGVSLNAHMAKFGFNNQQYMDYVNETPLIIPNLPKLIVQWIRRHRRP